MDEIPSKPEELEQTLPAFRDSSISGAAASVTETKHKLYEIMAKKAVVNLEKHGMKAFYAPTSQEALATIMGLIDEGATVGIGDSLTLYQIGVLDALQKGNYKLIYPWRQGASREENYDLRRQTIVAQVYATGSNAITATGELINIDGVGNRVASMMFGPEKVIIAAGFNKIAPNLEAGIKRAQEVAAPLSAIRHGWDTPCVKTGICSDCQSPDRICSVVGIIERDHGSKWLNEPRIHVVIVGEELGL